MKPQHSLKKSPTKAPAERVVKDIRRQTRRHFSAEDKIRIVLDGLRGEDSIAELCRKEGIAQSLYYTWSKEFMEAGKRRLAGDTARAATTGEVQDLRPEARALKECVADLTLENRLLKKSMIADGGDDDIGIQKVAVHRSTGSGRRSSIMAKSSSIGFSVASNTNKVLIGAQSRRSLHFPTFESQSLFCEGQEARSFVSIQPLKNLNLSCTDDRENRVEYS